MRIAFVSATPGLVTLVRRLADVTRYLVDQRAVQSPHAPMIRRSGSSLPGERAPSMRATPFLATEGAGRRSLTDAQREALTQLASRLRLAARMLLYEEESPARWLFMNAQGAVKAFRDLPSGKRRIAAFLFPGDIFGLAENVSYVHRRADVRAAWQRRVRRSHHAPLKSDEADPARTVEALSAVHAQTRTMS
jgi:Cyclic nucleotide-binding domain